MMLHRFFLDFKLSAMAVARALDPLALAVTLYFVTMTSQPSLPTAIPLLEHWAVVDVSMFMSWFRISTSDELAYLTMVDMMSDD